MIELLKKYNQFLIGILFLFYFLYTVSNSLELNKNILYATLLIVPIYFQTIFQFLYFYNKNGKPRLQDWFKLAVFFMLVLNYMSIVNTLNVNIDPNLYIVTNVVSLNNSPYAMIVIIFTLISLDVAYILHKSFFYKPLIYTESYTITRKNFIFILLIITTLFKFYLQFSGISGFGNDLDSNSGANSLLRMLSTYLAPVTLILCAYIIYIENYKNKYYTIIFYTSISLQVILGFLSGMKEQAISPILYVLVVFLISGRKIPKKLLLIGTLIIILLYPINNAYRSVISSHYLNTGSNITNMLIAINKVIEDPILDTLSSGIDSYSDRSSMLPFLLYSIENEEKWSYFKNMSRYLGLPVYWALPRVIWDEKPKADIGGVLYEQATGERTATSITVTTIGWAYLEGGLLFIIIIFILLGIIFEQVDNKNYKKPLVLVFYILLLHYSIKPEWDTYFMLSSLIQSFIIYWILLKFIGIQRINNEN